MIQLHDYLLAKKNFLLLLHLKKNKKVVEKKKQNDEEDSITRNIINKQTNIPLLKGIM